MPRLKFWHNRLYAGQLARTLHPAPLKRLCIFTEVIFTELENTGVSAR